MSSYVPRTRYGISEEGGLKIEDTDVRYVNEKGDKMKGPLDMNGNKITNVSSPVEDNEVVNKEYLKKKVDKIKDRLDKTSVEQLNNRLYILKNEKYLQHTIEQTNKNNKDLSEKIEKTKKDIEQNTKFTQKISDQLANKNDIIKFKNEIIQNIGKFKNEIIQNIPPNSTNITHSQKKDFDQKMLHANLRKAYLSLIPNDYDSIINMLRPIWREEPFVTEEKKFIYFPGNAITGELMYFNYKLPKNCTIFIVVKLFGKIGLVYLRGGLEDIFSLANLQVFHAKIKKMKPLEQRKKYSIVIEVKEQRIQRVRITNYNKILEAERPNIILQQLEIGNGHGVIYDLIIHDKLLQEEKIVEIYKSLNKIHKIYS